MTTKTTSETIKRIDVYTDDFITAVVGEVRCKDDLHGDDSGYRILLLGSRPFLYADVVPSDTARKSERIDLDPMLFIGHDDELKDSMTITVDGEQHEVEIRTV